MSDTKKIEKSIESFAHFKSLCHRYVEGDLGVKIPTQVFTALYNRVMQRLRKMPTDTQCQNAITVKDEPDDEDEEEEEEDEEEEEEEHCKSFDEEDDTDEIEIVRAPEPSYKKRRLN